MAKHEIRRMEIEPAENGGHMVTHYMKESPSKGGMAYQEPEKHVFGADEGHDMLAHIANHLEIPVEEKRMGLKPEAAERIREKAGKGMK